MPDEDGDGDSAPSCLDLCPGFDDDLDSDGDGMPDGCDPDRKGCARDADCDDEQDCTAESCVDGFCVTTPGEDLCPWPAEATTEGVNHSHLDDPANPEESYLRRNLSGAVWNPVSRTLWLARNGGPAIVWSLEEGEDPAQLAVAEGAVWGRDDDVDFGDLEALTFADFEETDTIFLLDESRSFISEWRLRPEDAQERTVWDLTADMPAPPTWRGPEGLTFVPDRFLEAQGFRNAVGEPAVSRRGTGGLFFVGHQEEGLLHVFDLDRESGEHDFVGTFHTGADETAGLEFDRSTGILWIFHGGSPMTLEASRLSWTEKSGDDGEVKRILDSMVVYEAPAVPEGGSTNLEGFALTDRSDCVDGMRSAFVTTDDGGDWSLIQYREFPCR